jgi:hypothetical protein
VALAESVLQQNMSAQEAAAAAVLQQQQHLHQQKLSQPLTDVLNVLCVGRHRSFAKLHIV